MQKMCRLRYVEVTLVSILLINFVIGKECDDSNLVDANINQCSSTELCRSGKCDCRKGFKRINDTYCLDTTKQDELKTPTSSSLVDNSTSGNVVAGILIPIVLLMVVISAVYFTRKYELIAWARSNYSFIAWVTNKINQRNSTYDEFMIGQDPDDDDPPLR